MVLCAAFILGGCSGGTGGSEGENDSTPGAIEVEEDLLTVDVRVARSLLDPNDTLTDEDIVAAAGEKGMSAAVDGDAVIYTMTKLQREELLTGMRTSTQSSIDDLIADDSNSIIGVEFDDAMTSFHVSVDGSRYSQLESLLVLAFYVPGALYQQFAGVPQEDVDVAVEFVDDTTGEVLNTGTYQEMRKNLEQ
ncbi:hypothetical protein [Microbacterium pygmaeum]|nr:hypothetical protein [Microbacterium pygmaeum]